MTHPLRLAAALGASVLACACSSTPAAPESTAQVSTFTTELDWSAFALGPNDVLRVGVYGHPELATEGTRVDGEGNLSLPLAGAVHVAGLSASEARAAVAAAYSRYIAKPRVELSVVTHGARRCYVFGEVTRPGAIDFDRPLTLMQMLSMAGGFTNKANHAEVVLLRGRPEALEVEVVDLEQPCARGFLALKPDDLVFVRRTNAGRFSDEVLPYLNGLSSALASAATIVLLDDALSGSK